MPIDAFGMTRWVVLMLNGTTVSSPPTVPNGTPTASSSPLSAVTRPRSEEHTSELQSQSNLVCRLLLEKKKMYDRSSSANRTQQIFSTCSTLHGTLTDSKFTQDAPLDATIQALIAYAHYHVTSTRHTIH